MDQKVKIRNLTLEAFSIYAGLNDNPIVAGAILRQENFALKPLGLDSLSLMEVSMHLEDGLGIELDVDELQGCDTLNGLVDHLAVAENRQRQMV
ncbi:MAG: acyl carrier protein [Gammaproteobacteria bacterium]